MSSGRFQFTLGAVGIVVTALAVYAAVLARLRVPHAFAWFAVPAVAFSATYLATLAPRPWRSWLAPAVGIIIGLGAFAWGLWLQAPNR